MDYDAHTVTIVGLEDLQVKQVLGRHGDPLANGTALHPAIAASQFAMDTAKFGNPASAAFIDGVAYVADGEDYVEQVDRIEAWTLDTAGTAVDDSEDSVQWVLPQKPPSKRTVEDQIFRTPHSIVYHQPSDKLIIGDW